MEFHTDASKHLHHCPMPRQPDVPAVGGETERSLRQFLAIYQELSANSEEHIDLHLNSVRSWLAAAEKLDQQFWGRHDPA
ncbi:hypothetical protein NQ015_05970 [Corynebacterium sp. 153RC1]|uniref:hypothetical protein n=1 Tax=unclassified Corynebacterium TaxID=2624378 RepID=UPI00211C54E2|nr:MULTISPECIES: hypothetical protein [unclassified Corynebacterium]MCQ9371145.1 hypothetical protein [Corynebacterium sp. 35RC1]MCQ9352554.1 hypothetical protein [Corynebacterium sp. 209RC1]MCQ9354738.1 hypothetical protein [Corynebacterium sp. 1222RC1]MCQ9356849.1 hypothetical protein [Corynebacterium sp. 122RC1]MCQ9358947.1 hypothetical protein [Corynebacterium sp. 142RC1]